MRLGGCVDLEPEAVGRRFQPKTKSKERAASALVGNPGGGIDEERALVTEPQGALVAARLQALGAGEESLQLLSVLFTLRGIEDAQVACDRGRG